MHDLPIQTLTLYSDTGHDLKVHAIPINTVKGITEKLAAGDEEVSMS